MVSKGPKRRAVRKSSKVAKQLSQSLGPRKPNGKPKTKLAAVIAALSAAKGATLAQLMALTGWQMHSVRGAISGALKKERGLAVTSTKVGDERVYRIETK